MKKIFSLIIVLMSIAAQAQVWIEVQGVYSLPMKSFSQSGYYVVQLNDGSTQTFSNEVLFQEIANPTAGYGGSIGYQKNNVISGFEGSFVKYNPSIDLGDFSLLRVGAFADYYFSNKKLKPYAGGEFNLVQSRVVFDREEVDAPRIDKTRIGIGPRAGIAYQLSDNLVLKGGARYVFVSLVPYVDFMLGLSVNLGDF
jgi:opacity protein-like surface antigen